MLRLWLRQKYRKTKLYTYYLIFLYNFKYIIGYFVAVFNSYSFYKTVKLKYFIGYDFVQEGSQIFLRLEMPVKLSQYRGSVGIFNNRNFVFRPKFTNFVTTGI